MKSNAKWIVLLCLCTLILVLLKPNIAFSDEMSEEEGTVQIEYIFEGVRFEIRKIADINTDNEYILCDEYKECQVSLDSSISSERKEQAETLEKYVSDNDIQCLHATRTNEYDVAMFENIGKGMYLITGETITSEGYTYSPLPVLVSIPDISTPGQEIFDIIIEPKYEKTEIIIPEEPTEPETPKPEEPTEPESPVIPGKPEPNIPHTGQKVGHIILCGLIAVTLYAIALTFRKRKRVCYISTVIGSLVIVIGIIFIRENVNKNAQVQVQAKEIVSELQDIIVEKTEDGLLLEETVEIPIEENVVTVEDKDYIGIINIPKIDKELPVMNKLTNENLEISPCLYYTENDDIIIGAHNYDSLFGRIINLSVGDEITFTDINNNEICYEVSGIEIINPDERDLLVSGEWDMTLFTCTYMGKQRVVVRCNEI